MTFSITALPPKILGGRPGAAVDEPSFKAGSSDLTQFLHEQMADERPPNSGAEVFTAYIREPDCSFVTLICREYVEVVDIPINHVFTRIPQGIYALFTSAPGVRDPRQDVWTQVEQASDSGAIRRAGKEELEVFQPTGVVELYIAIDL